MNTKIDFNNFSQEYNKLLQNQHKKFGDISYYSKYKVDILKNLLDKSKKYNILEFGCGIGRNLPFLKSSFHNSTIYGLDISEESIKIAKKNNPDINFISNNNLKEFDDFFDIIFIAGVYHHISLEERTSVTKQLHSLLKQNGTIIIFEHNPYNPLTMKMVNTCEFDKDAIVLKKSELIHLFISNNFYHVKSNYTLFLPPKLKLINFIEEYLGWCPLGGQYYIMVKKC